MAARITLTPLDAARVRLGAVPTTDSATLDAAQLQRIQAFLRELAAREADTNALIALRTQRMAGAERSNVTDAQPNRTKFAWYRMPLPASGCPPTGILDLSWGDIFARCTANLAALAASKPPRWTSGVDVVRWMRAVQWNVVLLRDATNIRPVFLWPNAIPPWRNSPGEQGVPPDAEQRRGSSTTLYTTLDDGSLIEGLPYPCGSGFGCGAPASVQALTRTLLPTRTDADGGVPGWRDGDGVLHAALPGDGLWIPAPQVTTLDWLATGADPDGINLAGLFSFLNPQRVGNAPGAVVDKPLTTGAGSDWARLTGGAAPFFRLIDQYNRSGSFVKLPNSVYFWPGRVLDAYAAFAAAYAREVLADITMDSIGWYVFNHVEYWTNRGKIEMSVQTLDDLKRQSQDARLRGQLGMAVGSVRALTTLAIPVAGAIAGLLAEIGFTLLGEFIRLDTTGPQTLFVRSYPAGCAGSMDVETLTSVRTSIATAAEAAARVAEAARAARVPVQSNVPTVPWALVGGGAVALLLLVALARRKK